MVHRRTASYCVVQCPPKTYKWPSKLVKFLLGYVSNVMESKQTTARLQSLQDIVCAAPPGCDFWALGSRGCCAPNANSGAWMRGPSTKEHRYQFVPFWIDMCRVSFYQLAPPPKRVPKFQSIFVESHFHLPRSNSSPCNANCILYDFLSTHVLDCG